MQPAEWTKVLFVICTFYTSCTSSKSISQYTNHHDSVGQEFPYKMSWFENKRNEAQCNYLFKRRHIEQLNTRYWMLIEKNISPYYRHKCLKYLAAYLTQFTKKKTQQTRNLLKRDADSDQMDPESKEADARKKLSENKKDPMIGPTTTRTVPSTIGKQFYNKATLDDSRPYGEGNNRGIQTSTPSEDTGLAFWVFIVIGIAAVIVIVIPLAVTLIYYKKRRALKHRPENLTPTCGASDLMYETQRSRSTDKGTERSKSTVSTYLSKDSQDIAECHELVPLRKGADRERSSVIRMFQDIESDNYEDEPVRCRDYDLRRRSPTRVKVINTSEYCSDLNYSQLQDYGRTSQMQTDWEAASFDKSRQDYGYRLYGGNVDVHRSAGSQEESCEINTYRPPLELTKNESRSSSSTRSYISIPPTSPSENYIKAGLDDVYLPSEHHTTLTKMAWLTKNLKGDAKNEFSNYHASSGTQTDSDSSITGPNGTTVFGTPWQFGGTFTSRGGVMQAKDSDVCLVVVPNAVPKGEYVDIYGAIFTDTTEIRKKLIFSTKESLITPVVEYHTHPVNPFRRQVCVQLPHALPEEFDISLIKVYTFIVDEYGTVSLSNIPVSSKVNDDRDIEAHWEKGVDGHSIHISTTHFSGYFCTQCESTSWPSICTMVFGSHVQITQSRREVRVILYIWDHRLTIKDYLERFRKQESDVDRQLLTDMQVPLLDSASSNSRLIMCMEVMGGDDDRQCWRHIFRSDGSRPLFKPLQVRKLSEIVHCCRQTDPIRVEWALENKPTQVPSAVFQCCIDVMHVHESTRNYETAMREDSDDLMRTFYVRDLKVMTNSNQEPEQRPDFQRVDLKRTLSETMDISQTERMCQEFGISIKDIGNFRKKYSTQEAFQIGLVEECLKRHGPDTFLNLLPKILERLHYTEVLTALDDKKILARKLTDLTNLSDPAAKSVNENVPQSYGNLEDDEDSTRYKSPYRRTSTSPNGRNRSTSPLFQRKNMQCPAESNAPELQKEVSERSCEVFAHKQPQHKHLKEAEHHNRSLDRESRQNRRHSGHLRDSPPIDYSVDDGGQFVNENMKYSVISNAGQNTEERQLLKKQRSSSSGGDSVLGSRSEQSKDNASAYFPSWETLGTSMIAHADPKDFAEPVSDAFLDNYLKQTYKKELLAKTNMHDHYLSEDNTPHPNARDGHLASDCGPYAMPPDSKEAILSSVSDPVPPYKKSTVNQRLHDNSQKQDKNQTFKKELFGTVV